MEPRELTEEQKQKLKALFWSTTKKNALIGAKYGILLFAANAVICVLDALYVHSTSFAFLGGMMNAIFIFRAMGKETRKEHDRLKEEAKKILSQ